MKVLLVHPPTHKMLPSILPEKVESNRGANPPLGILYLAAALRKEKKHEVAVLDAQAPLMSYADIEKKIADYKPDVTGVTTLSFTLPDALEICAIAKKHGATTVLGGPHAHIYPDETARLAYVDFVLRGEGEKTFGELIDCIEAKEPPTKVAGAVRLDNGAIKKGPEPAFIDDLDSLPHPARDLTDVNAYSSVLALTTPITTAMSSRGCPYRCVFCDRPHLGRKFRFRSPESVLDEIEKCVAMGIREFLFYDDNFATDRNRVVAIAEEILRRNLKVTIDARLRVTDIDAEIAALLKRAGCDRVHMGVESGDDEILKKLRKGITIEQAHRAFEAANDAGIKTLAYFLIGCPSETRRTVERTIKLAKALKPDYVHFSLLMPFPGTDLYRDGIEQKIWSGDPWLEYAKAPDENFVPPVWSENFTREESIELTLDAYRTFYRDPFYILRRLKKVRSAGEIARQVRAGLKILRL